MRITDDAKDPPTGQYSLSKILTIWALAAIPMPVLAFVIAPAVSPGNTWQAGITVWFLLIGGMIWQFLLSILILWRELESFTWPAIKARIWLKKPTDPKTGKASYKLFWWLIPAFLFYGVAEQSPIGAFIGELVLIPFPGLATLPQLRLETLMVPELVGAWWLVGVALLACLFNYFLGEELLFRGILLPKMSGVFGKWDWAANAVLFAIYHLHRPVQMLSFILGGMAWTLPSRRFRSIWFAIILHGFEGIPAIVGAVMVASGLAFR